MAFGILSAIFLLPLFGSVITYIVTVRKEKFAKTLALFFTVVTFLLTIVASLLYLDPANFGTFAIGGGLKMGLIDQVNWVPQVGITYFLGVDGLSMPLVVLSGLVSVAAILASPKDIKRGPLYFSLILLLQTGIYGTFMALDFFLFFINWELVLVPMFFLVGIWGGPKREYAAIYFFIYTHVASLVLLLGIVGLWVVNVTGGGTPTFSMLDLAGANLVSPLLPIIFAALFFGFIVKVPTVPFHTWLPLAHVEAPSPISMILAGLLLKMGGYGIIRVNFMILPDLFTQYADIIAILGLISLFFGGLVAMRQQDMKRLVAYSSIAHMGMVLLGAAISAVTGRPEGLIGALVMMIAHGFISPMMFDLCGVIQHSTNTRLIDRLGGLTQKMPTVAGLLVFSSMASLGLPALAGFVSEFYVFLAAFSWNQTFLGGSWPVYAFIAIFGVVITVGFYLWLLQRIIWGKASETIENAHLPGRWEYTSLWLMAIPIILIGIFPFILIEPIAETFITLAGLAG
jgi:NADH-quinone oxidoreductase subunit M